MNWQQLDWAALDRLRETFLHADKSTGPYWRDERDLAAYDATYGQRIGWKWDAVLTELVGRELLPTETGLTVFDWGCGSGVAGRQAIRALGERVQRLWLWDHSSAAVAFAARRAREMFPHLEVRALTAVEVATVQADVLVLSHVLNELPTAPAARADFQHLLERVRRIWWVEPGTHAVSRALGEWRERLRTVGFTPLAPCPHAGACGALAVGKERDWCHFFATPPAEIFADSDWVKFGQRAGIDLRSLPYAFLVLSRASTKASPPEAGRVLGRPEVFKGYARMLNCGADGLTELTLQERADKRLFKSLKRDSGLLLFRWERDGDRITAAERMATLTQNPDLPAQPENLTTIT